MMLSDLSAINVICIPENRVDYIRHYDKVKCERSEMYPENMANVYDMYKDAWNGTRGVRHSNKTFNKIYNEAKGLKQNESFFLYDFIERGDDLKTVCAELLVELTNASSRC